MKPCIFDIMGLSYFIKTLPTHPVRTNSGDIRINNIVKYWTYNLMKRTKLIEHKNYTFNVYEIKEKDNFILTWFALIHILVFISSCISLPFYNACFRRAGSVSLLFLELISPIQYLLLMHYFKNNLSRENIKFNDSVGYILLLIAALLSVLSCYDSPFLFPLYFISFLPVITSIYIFSFVLYYFGNHLKTYVEKLTNFKDNLNEISGLNCIVEDIAIMKARINNSIKGLSYSFNIFTIFGSTGIAYYVLYPENPTYSLYVNIFLYSIVQLIYISFICFFNEQIQTIRDIINEPYFIQKYLNRKTDSLFSYNEKTEKMDTQLISINLLEENATTIDWIVVNKLVNDNWIDFTIFGIEIGNGGEFIKKACALIAVGFTIFNITLRV